LAQVHEANLAHHFENMEQQNQANTLGIWLFLGTEILFFGAILGAYAIYRDRYPAAFALASEMLSVPVAAFNTVVLIGSSLTVVLAVHAVRLGKNGLLQLALWLTVLLALVFLGVKAYEYHEDYVEQMIPGIAKLDPARSFSPEKWTETWVEQKKHKAGNSWTEGDKEAAELEAKQMLPQGELFFCFYFVTTGLHAVHMIIGLGIFAVLIYQVRRGVYTPTFRSPIEVTGLYWHFVDIVWVWLFPLLYLIRH
jgi:cytochrome c oxidase subunit 3